MVFSLCSLGLRLGCEVLCGEQDIRTDVRTDAVLPAEPNALDGSMAPPQVCASAKPTRRHFAVIR